MWQTLLTAYIKGIGKTVTLGQALFSLLRYTFFVIIMRNHLKWWKEGSFLVKIEIESSDHLSPHLVVWHQPYVPIIIARIVPNEVGGQVAPTPQFVWLCGLDVGGQMIDMEKWGVSSRSGRSNPWYPQQFEHSTSLSKQDKNQTGWPLRERSSRAAFVIRGRRSRGTTGTTCTSVDPSEPSVRQSHRNQSVSSLRRTQDESRIKETIQ